MTTRSHKSEIGEKYSSEQQQRLFPVAMQGVCRHFSVARRQSYLFKEYKNKNMMSKDNKKLQIFMFAQRTTGVSKALWPAKIRRIVATDKAAQRRRSRIVSREWEILPAIPRTPETPLPAVPARVRVLETVDLSRSNVEHFLDTAKH